MFTDLYRSAGKISCFEGDADPGLEPAGGTAAGVGSPAPDSQGGEKTFTQVEVNKMMQEHKKNLQTAKEQAEHALQEALKSNELTQKDRKTLEQQLEMVRATALTKEEAAASERKRLEEGYKTEITALSERATGWESRYRTSEVNRSIQDAAVAADAFNPQQLVTLLQPWTKFIEEVDEKNRPTGNYKVMIEFPDTHPDTGEPIATLRTPADALSRMKEKPEVWGNLFKHNIAPGIGGNSNASFDSSRSGQVDMKKLASNPEQLRKLMQEKPELFGLRKNFTRR